MTAPGSGVTASRRRGATPGAEADLADRLVVAVCRPADVATVRAAVDRVDPDDLAGLVAAVDQHQPMALEVVVDVLAELGVAPPAIAVAMGVDVQDVVAMLGGPLGNPPAPRVDGDARIIEVVAPTDQDDPTQDDAADAPGDGPGDTDGHDDAIPVDVEEDAVEDETVEEGGREGAGREDAAGRPAADASGDRAVAVTVRIDEVAEDEEVARTVAHLEDDAAGLDRRRIVWAVVLFLLVAGGVVAGALVWWWP